MITHRSLAAVLAISLLSSAPAVAQPAPEPPPPWDAQVGASFVGTAGNTDTSTLGVDFSAHRRWPIWKLEATATSVRSTDEGERTAERYLGAVRVDRRLNDLLSLSAGERAERDRPSGIALRSILDGGLSWALLRLPRWTVDGVTGLAWKHERPINDIVQNRPTGVFQATSRIPFGNAGETTQRVTFYPDFKERADYRSEAELAAQAAMTDRLALKIGYLWRYSNQPVPGFQQADSTATASVVLRWRGAAPTP